MHHNSVLHQRRQLQQQHLLLRQAHPAVYSPAPTISTSTGSCCFIMPDQANYGYTWREEARAYVVATLPCTAAKLQPPIKHDLTFDCFD
jgi:hypothetical protein